MVLDLGLVVVLCLEALGCFVEVGRVAGQADPLNHFIVIINLLFFHSLGSRLLCIKQPVMQEIHDHN